MTARSHISDNDVVKEKWTRVDQAGAEPLTGATLTPGVICSAGTSGLPQTLQSMPGVVSYFVSGYTAPVAAAAGVPAAGEMVVVRRDGELAKAYNYVFATSSGGGVYLTGPFKHFDGHHMATTSGVALAGLFGHSPWYKNP